MKPESNSALAPISGYVPQTERWPAASSPAPAFARLRRPTAGTYLRTARHLKLSQIAHLALRRGLGRSLAPVAVKGPISLRGLPQPMPILEWQPEAARRMLSTREFRFLNLAPPQATAIPWNDAELPKLWVYHLNYFDYLCIALDEGGDAALATDAVSLMLDWIERNPSGSEIGWEPYPLSLRIVNWLKFLERNRALVEGRAADGALPRILSSLASQAATLEKRLERDLLANHFFKNIKALIFAGALIETESAARWRRLGAELLRQQLREQVLADGGHFERSLMYHSIFLEDLTDIEALGEASGLDPAARGFLAEKRLAMADFLASTLHPDGEIPLLNDASIGVAASPRELLERSAPVVEIVSARSSEVRIFPSAGYGTIRDRDSESFLVLDCGPVGPDYQPGHAHCDLLSYELSLRGRRWIVDTGVSTYAIAPERSYERSTAAHNTVRLDGGDQAETWASFRVGRRPNRFHLEGGRQDGLSFLRGRHNAYRRLGVSHSRLVVRGATGAWWFVDRLDGRGKHRVEWFVHFHPEVSVAPIAEQPADAPVGFAWSFEVSQASEQYRVLTPLDGELQVESAWYAERFGKRIPQHVLRWSWAGKLPLTTAYAMVPENASPDGFSADASGHYVRVGGVQLAVV